MAIFNRQKEKWIPTKPLNKTTKNRTIHLERDSSSSSSPKKFNLNARLWFYLDAVSIDSTDVYNFTNLNADNNGYDVVSLKHEGVDPAIDDIEVTRFDHQAIRFGYDGNQGYVQSNGHVGNLAEILFTKNSSNQYKSVDSACWISFWYKSPDRYPGASNLGQSIGGFLRQDPTDASNPTDTQPSLGIYITSTGKISVRMSTVNTDSSDLTPRIDTDIFFAERVSSRSTHDNEWNLVSICMPISAGATTNLADISAKDFVADTRIWINGVEDTQCSNNSFGDFNVSSFGVNHWLVLGNSNSFWATTDTDPLDSSENIVNASEGFEGWIGEFLILNYHDSNLDGVGRFLYEAFREGSFGVHSGTHNSEPLREIKEQRRIRYYPPNNGGADQHLLTTENRNMFEEGRSMLYNPDTSIYDTPESFNYDASKFYKQSNVILPHLKTNPDDEVLQHWLSPDRSVFFAEDLDIPSNGGFSILSDSIVTSDWLYRDTKQEQTVGPFNDYIRDEDNESFVNSFTIDIPIAQGGSTQCILSTNSSSETGMITGTSPSVTYTGFWIGDVTIYYPTSGFAQIKWGSDNIGVTTTATPDPYWVPVVNTISSSTIPKWKFFNYAGPTAPSLDTNSGAQLDPAEYDAWRGIISYLKHALLAYHWPQIKTRISDGESQQAAWWNEFVLDRDGNIRDFYLNNPYHANVVSAIMKVPTGAFEGDVTSIQPIYNPATTSTDWQYLSAAIHLLKGLGGINLENGSTILYPNDITPKKVSEIQISETNYHDLGKSVTAGTGTIGTFILIPSTQQADEWGYSVADYAFTKVVANYTQAAAAAFWTPGLYPNHVNDASGNPWITHELLSGGSLALQDPSIEITTMAYHNFSTGEWEERQSFSSTESTEVDPTRFVHSASIGFSPMTNLVYPFDVDKLEEIVDSAGRPTSAYGFPFHEKYDASNNQTLDLSQYISESVILKGWELKMDVIPQVGVSSSDIDFGGSSGYDFDGIRGLINSNVIASGDYSSPILFAEYINGSSKYQYGNSFPTGTKNQSSTSQATKGVTAFLLRQSDFIEPNLSLDMYTSNPREYTFYSNHYSGSQVKLTKQPELKGIHEFDIGPNDIGNSTTLQSGPHSSTFFDNSKTRELLGYLQHVYHNDSHWSQDSNYKVRIHQNTLLDLSLIPGNQTVHFDNVFNRENNTFITTLHGNTATYDFHVTGSIKSNSKMSNFSVVSPFFIRANRSVSANSGNAFLDTSEAHDTDTQNFVTNYSIVDSWNGGSGTGDLSDGSSAVGIAGQEFGDVLPISRFAVPMSGAIGAANRKIEHLNQKMSINPEKDSEVILHPHDKLVLGIQDSISTVLGSQMIDEAGNLAKWGRNSLKIPHQQTGSYLRLFVERQRNGKGYAPRSNQSHGFTEDVNEALGNVIISDSYETAPLRMYSGSMSDDIMSPHPFTQAKASLRVQYSQFQGTATSEFDPTGPVLPSFSNTVSRDYAVSQASPPHEEIKYNWLFLNELTFKDRTPNTHTHASGDSCFYSKPNFKELMDPGTTNASPVDNYALLGSLQVGIWPVSTAIARINPRPEYTSQHINSRYGGCCALWELNRNPARVVPTLASNKMTVDNSSNDFSFSPTAENPAFSSWKFKAIFPLFTNSATDVKWKSLLLTARIIALDQDNLPQAYNPNSGGSWETLQPGDIFTFSSTASDAVRGSHPVLLWNVSAGVGSESTGSSWSEHAYASGSDLLADIYIVAAQGHVATGFSDGDDMLFSFQSSGSYNPWHNVTVPITWNAMMGSIKEILKSEVAIKGLNYTVGENNVDTDWFQIEYIADDFALARLVEKQATFNSLLEFSLLGTSGDFATNDIPDSKIWAYRDENMTNNQGYNNTTIGNWGFNQFQKETGSGSSYTVSTVDNTVVSTDRMMTDTYFRQHSDYTAGSLNPSHNAFDHEHTGFNISIDYSNLPKQKAIMIDIKSAFTPASVTEYPINKKVTFRTTEGTAGPFGSLNKFQKLVNNQTFQKGEFIDSYPRNIFNQNSSFWTIVDNEVVIDLTDPISSNWPCLEYPTDSVASFDQSIKKVIVPGTVDGPNSILSLPIPESASSRDDAMLIMKDDLRNTVTFELDGSNGTDIELKDHIGENFPSLSSIQKTLGDLAGGFGQGLQNRLVFRPSIFKHVAFDNNNGGDAQGDVTHFFLKIDPIRGARYGLSNTRKQSRSFIFSRNSYGQVKDMMEQSLDGAYVIPSANINHDPSFGPPIFYSSKNPNDPRIEVELKENNRRNKDRYQRVYYPMFDRTGDDTYDYGLIAPSGSQIQDNLPDFDTNSNSSGVNSETLEEYTDSGSILEQASVNRNITVGLPGVIATNAVVSPGTIRSSIRDD